MNPLGRYPVLASLLKPFRHSQQKTCAVLVAALCQAAQASSFAIAGQLSCLTDMQLGSALTRLYRFLRNDRFDNRFLTERLLRLPGRRPGPLLLALDCTAWQDRFSVLTAAVCAGTRAIPVAVSACHKPHLARSQNLREETFLRLTVDRLRAAGVSAVWLCDRGFHRLLARGEPTTQTDSQVRAPTSAATTAANLQVADGSAKVISGVVAPLHWGLKKGRQSGDSVGCHAKTPDPSSSAFPALPPLRRAVA